MTPGEDLRPPWDVSATTTDDADDGMALSEADAERFADAPPDVDPMFLSRMEVFRATQDLGFTTNALVKRLMGIVNTGSDANALRAADTLSRLVRKTDDDEGTPATGSNGNSTTNAVLAPNMQVIIQLLEKIEPTTRRALLEAMGGAGDDS